MSMMSTFSVVEYIGDSNAGKCGYCNKPAGSNSSGFWAHSLLAEDYQALINRFVDDVRTNQHHNIVIN